MGKCSIGCAGLLIWQCDAGLPLRLASIGFFVTMSIFWAALPLPAIPRSRARRTLGRMNCCFATGGTRRLVLTFARKPKLDIRDQQLAIQESDGQRGAYPSYGLLKKYPRDCRGICCVVRYPVSALFQPEAAEFLQLWIRPGCWEARGRIFGYSFFGGL